jgi:hypothetical protein
MKKTVLAVLLTLPLLFAAASAYAGGCCSDDACCAHCTDCKH